MTTLDDTSRVRLGWAGESSSRQVVCALSSESVRLVSMHHDNESMADGCQKVGCHCPWSAPYGPSDLTQVRHPSGQYENTGSGCQPFEQQAWRCHRNGGSLLCVCEPVEPSQRWSSPGMGVSANDRI
jgi:hypothetical protein